MNNKNDDIEFTQRFIVKNKKKKRTIKNLLISLGTLTLATGAAVGLVIIIDAAKDNKI